MAFYEHKTKKGPVIVAEISGNHGGKLEIAQDLMLLAKKHGADAIKIQTYEADSLTIDSKREEFMIRGGLWAGQSLYELYQKACTPRSFVKPLFEFAKEHEIFLFSSPFSAKDVEVLEENACPAYKIASFELVDVDLIALCASTKKPLVMSVGLANLEEIERAYNVALKHGASEITLLHCESHYPAEPYMFNLKTISFLKHHFNCHVGLSNHALGSTLDIAATALGAQMIEKHFIDDRQSGEVDAAFSMTPQELSNLVKETEDVAQALGEEAVVLKEIDVSARGGRRSVYLVKDIAKGEVLSADKVKVIRPACGLEPYLLPTLLGKKAKCDLKAPLPLKACDFD